MIIEIHMLKSFAPTNLNRDDTGSPKSCMFGGVQRGRISSQCLKRAWRTSGLLQNEKTGVLGLRTRKLPLLVWDKLEKSGVDDTYRDAVIQLVSGFGKKEEKAKDEEKAKNEGKLKDGGKVKDEGITNQIIFYADADITAVADAVAALIKEGKKPKDIQDYKAVELQKAISKTALRPITLDIALFGRMVTSDAFRDVEAAMQVAHAISTHKMSPESDYFTAVDDLISGDSGDDTGAGMMGDVEYNACCYYIYGCIDTDQLASNLSYTPDAKKIADAAVLAVLEAMVYANPSGKQNTFAGHSLPEVVLIEKKTRKIPLSYANAFVEPARTSDKCSLVKNSIQKLAAEVDVMDEKYGLAVDERLWLDVRNTAAPKKCDVCGSFKEMLEKVRTCTAE